jgi:glutamate synthase (NADPH) small chain
VGKITGFLEYGREVPERRAVIDRVKDWFEVYQPFPEEKVRLQGARCMDCGVPFCHTGCPLSNIIPDWNDLVYRDRWRDAIRVLHSTNNFPEFTGRICPAPCEAACVLGINEPPVTIKVIERTIVDYAWREGWIKPELAPVRTAKRVAVVGSGPAGLAAAQQLARAGHDVTVYEKADRPGGLLRYGIPDFKMEKHLIDRRLDQMTAEGVRFVCNSNAGVDVTGEELLAGFDAILLAGGAEHPRDIPIAGRQLNGIHFAMDFLPPNNDRQRPGWAPQPDAISARGKNVIIIGGGDTGSDCLGTSHRHGARSVTMFEIIERPPDERDPSTPWPLWPFQFRQESSHEEGVDRRFSILTKEFIGDAEGNVRQLKTVGVKPSRRPPFEEIPGTEETLDVDLVLLALGFQGPRDNGLFRQLGVALDSRTNVKANEQDYRTNVEKVFAAGDTRRGQSLVVWAIAEGRNAARSIDHWLMGSTRLR